MVERWSSGVVEWWINEQRKRMMGLVNDKRFLGTVERDFYPVEDVEA